MPVFQVRDAALLSLDGRLEAAKLFVDRTIPLVDKWTEDQWQKNDGGRLVDDEDVDLALDAVFGDLPPVEHAERIVDMGFVMVASALESFLRLRIRRWVPDECVRKANIVDAPYARLVEVLRDHAVECKDCADWPAVEKFMEKRNAMVHNDRFLSQRKRRKIHPDGPEFGDDGTLLHPRLNDDQSDLYASISAIGAFARELAPRCIVCGKVARIRWRKKRPFCDNCLKALSGAMG